MDNPQHYQPLSYALNPPLATQHQYSASPSNFVSGSAAAGEPHEEEEEDDDEGIVEEQLHENDGDLQHPDSEHHSPEGDGHDSEQNVGPSETNGHITEPTSNDVEQHDDQGSPPKRRPGRPRGSKNRMKATAAAEAVSAMAKKTFQQPSAPVNVNAQNQQYYEFQWRVLNLCAEFYGAAEELVKATPPLVISQSYQMGPSIKIDPINMLGEAKRICDSLLANPSQLTTHPPPPMYTQITGFEPPPGSAAPSHSASSTGKFSAKPSSVPTNVQSFTVPLAAQSGGSSQQTQYIPAPYPPQPAPQFPTLPYYYAPPYTAPFISVTPTVPTLSPATQSTSQPSGPRGEGAWTDEEQQRLKQLAEQSKSVGKTGNIEWDWVVNQWGSTRTRHQILTKATALGLKKVSSTRGQKRRRESSHVGDEDSTPTPAPTASASAPGSVVPQATTSISPPLSQPVSAQPSPAVQHAHPQTVASAVPARVSWPAPIIAANTPPIVTSSDPQRGTYYRANDPSMKPDSLSSHHYVYQPNGKGTGTSKFSKQNGR